jgi:hypothetical protein
VDDDMIAVKTIMEELANETYNPALADNVCCSESIISRKAIRQYPHKNYVKLLEIIYPKRHEGIHRWGYAFERLYAQLFNHCNNDDGGRKINEEEEDEVDEKK